MTPVTEFITRPFLVQYGAPNTIDQKAFIAKYEEILGGTDPELLKAAGIALIKQHTYGNWPTPGECVNAIEVIATRRSLQRERGQWGKGHEAPREEPSAESRARVDALMRETIAKLKVSGPPPPKGAVGKPIDWSRTSKSVLGELYRAGKL